VRAVAIVERRGAGHGVSRRIHDREVRRVRAFAEADDGIRRGAGANSLVAHMGFPACTSLPGSGAMRINGGEKFPLRNKNR